MKPHRHKDFAESIIRAFQEEAQDVELQAELRLWDITLSDGIPTEE